MVGVPIAGRASSKQVRLNKITAYLGFGSNLGERLANLESALRLLGEKLSPAGEHTLVNQISDIYETAPWGPINQPHYLNCSAKVTTTLAPRQLLQQAKAVEFDLGRQPGPRYGPRLIDVDILLYGDQIFEESELQIPHPRLHLRAFALVSLAELAGSMVHPVLNESIGALAKNVEGLEGLKRLGRLI